MRTVHRVLVVFALVLFGSGRAFSQGGLATGTLASTGDVVTIPMQGVASATIQAAGTWIGVIVVAEVTPDGGTTWYAGTVVDRQVNGFNQALQTTSVNGIWTLVNSGFTAARVRAMSLSSGSVAITATRGYVTTAVTPCNALWHAAGRC